MRLGFAKILGKFGKSFDRVLTTLNRSGGDGSRRSDFAVGRSGFVSGIFGGNFVCRIGFFGAFIFEKFFDDYLNTVQSFF